MASKRKLWIIVLALALGMTSLAAMPAAADTINLSYRGTQGVTINLNGSNQGTNTAEFYSNGLYNGLQWIGYCVDISQVFGNPLTVTPTSSWTGTSPGSTNWLEAAWLMEHYAPGMSWLNNNSSVDYNNAATKNTIQSVQLAIWEVIINPAASYSSGSLNTGTFRASGTTATTAGGMLDALNAAKIAGGGSVSLSGGYQFVVGSDPNRQDVLLAAKTPEPATLLMAASGLGALAFRRRRKKQD